MVELQSIFLKLARQGIDESKDDILSSDVSWPQLKTIAELQGLSAIVLDGIEELPKDQKPPQKLLLKWIGEVLQGESIAELQREVSVDMGKLFYRNAIRTYILKGAVVSECYPKPNHRVSADVDCYLLPEKGDFDAWSLGNDLIRKRGYNVNTDFYKNSSFEVSGVVVENHQFLTPFRGNKRMVSLEKRLRAMLRGDRGDDIIEGTRLCRPPVMVSALFLIEHAYSHFLHEGLTWRLVLDWMMYSRKHREEIDWAALNAYVDEFGFRKFYDSFSRLGQYLIGEIQEPSCLCAQDQRMLEDVWAPLDLHETVRGWRGKLALAGNTWRARWKYRYFTEMSWVRALWIQVKGVLFERNPKLG